MLHHANHPIFSIRINSFNLSTPADIASGAAFSHLSSKLDFTFSAKISFLYDPFAVAVDSSGAIQGSINMAYRQCKVGAQPWKMINEGIPPDQQRVRKLGKSYGQLYDFLLQHAQMEEKVVFPILQKEDRGVFVRVGQLLWLTQSRRRR